MEITTTKCRTYGHPEFVVQCGDSIPPPDLEWLVELLESTVCDGGRFSDGQLVQIGWSFVRVATTDGEQLTIQEPDRRAIPIEWSAGVTATLRDLRLQKDTAESLELRDSMNFPTIHESAVLGVDVFRGEGNVTLERVGAKTPDSGWFVGSSASRLDYRNPANLRRVSLYELAIHCPQAVMFMALPEGVRVECSRDRLLVLLNGVAIAPLEGSFLNKLLIGRRKHGTVGGDA